MSYEKLYHELLVDHYKHPRNKKTLEDPDFAATIFNPLCGDEITVQGKVKENNIIELGFDGKGCVISLAVGSLLTEKVMGSSIEQASKLTKQDILDLIKVELGPTRLRCALLALEALQKGLSDATPGKTTGGS